MARHPFFGGPADWAFIQDGSHVPVLQAGSSVTCWPARTGGSQYLDLALDAGGTVPVTGVLSSDGTDGYSYGDIPVLYGPDEVLYVWASVDGGPRKLVLSADVAALASATAAALSAHLAGGDPLAGRTVSFTRPGAVATGVGKFPWVNLTGVDVTLRKLSVYLYTAGSSNTTIDVLKNLSTLYPTGKPTLGSGVSQLALSPGFVIAAGDILTVDVTAAGTGAQDLTVQLDMW